MEAALNHLAEFLNDERGKRANRYLKDGAAFKVILDKKPFSLKKQEEKMEMNSGKPEAYDVVLELTSSAVEYFSNAETEDETYERIREIIHQPTAERYFRMKTEVESTQQGRIKFYWLGYYFWAKRMGLYY